eukprot:Platyproteum_vivax@DN4280_c0_g1_i1.p1
MYFNRGSLPWQGLKVYTKKEKYSSILEKKRTIPAEVLGAGYPSEFVTFLGYARSLSFEERPDYAYLRRVFKEVFHRFEYKKDGTYDWTVSNYLNQYYLRDSSAPQDGDVETGRRDSEDGDNSGGEGSAKDSEEKGDEELLEEMLDDAGIYDSPPE